MLELKRSGLFDTLPRRLGLVLSMERGKFRDWKFLEGGLLNYYGDSSLIKYIHRFLVLRTSSEASPPSSKKYHVVLKWLETSCDPVYPQNSSALYEQLIGLCQGSTDPNRSSPNSTNGILLSEWSPIVQQISSNWLPISRVSAQNWEHSLYPIMLDKFELLVFKDQVWRIFRSLSGRILNIPAESISLWNHHDTSFESWTLIFSGVEISGRSWENGRCGRNDRLKR